jgi:hypothetical protein
VIKYLAIFGEVSRIRYRFLRGSNCQKTL